MFLDKKTITTIVVLALLAAASSGEHQRHEVIAEQPHTRHETYTPLHVPNAEQEVSAFAAISPIFGDWLTN